MDIGLRDAKTTGPPGSAVSCRPPSSFRRVGLIGGRIVGGPAVREDGRAHKHIRPRGAPAALFTHPFDLDDEIVLRGSRQLSILGLAEHDSPTDEQGHERVAPAEFGSGCRHSDNSAKAPQVRATTPPRNSPRYARSPGSYEVMRVHVHLAVLNPDEVDLAVARASRPARCCRYSHEGGMLCSSRAGLPQDEPKEALKTVANACVTVGWNEDVFSSDTFSWNSEDESS